MKTNQIMLREGICEQRTKDGYFNSTLTSKNWELSNPKNKKTVSEYLRIKGTADLLNVLKQDEGIEHPYFSSNKGTWMHPLLYVDFCMWISVDFKVQVLKWVLDGLIKTRNEAGDYHKEMCATIMNTYISIYGTKPPAMLFINESRMIKQIANLNIERNEMSEKDLSRITILQKVNANLISKNVGKTSRIKHLTIVNESLL